MGRLGDLVDVVVVMAFAILIFVVIPGIIPAALWFILSPATFWQKLTWFIVSAITYLFVLGIELSAILESG